MSLHVKHEIAASPTHYNLGPIVARDPRENCEGLSVKMHTHLMSEPAVGVVSIIAEHARPF